jgi:multicomponent Na+:H+ antiporter subunit E
MPTERLRRSLPGFAGRALMFALVWAVLAGADPSSWIIGIPATLLAALAAMRLRKRGDGMASLLALARFVPYFLMESVRGGADVASRVLRPRLRIAPGIHPYRLRLISTNARVFFLDSVSLLPGTLSADLQETTLHVHALDVNDDIDDALRDLENRVARLFGETLDPAPDGGADPQAAAP